MPIHCSGVAEVQHATTGKIHKIHSDELHWERTPTNDRSMGPEWCNYAVVHHSELGELSWNVFEYPEGAEISRETRVGLNRVILDFSYGLEDESPDALEARDQRIDEMVEWFHSNYEDPANHMPYESAEGGYQWIWGGPYDASDVLQDEFS